jgi:hypothetical protein
MTRATEAAIGLVAGLAWLAGVVYAAGWWKVAAVFCPFYAWYLVVERALRGLGWL